MSSEGKRLKNSQTLDFGPTAPAPKVQTPQQREMSIGITELYIFIFCWHQVCAKCHVSCYSLL